MSTDIFTKSIIDKIAIALDFPSQVRLSLIGIEY